MASSRSAAACCAPAERRAARSLLEPELLVADAADRLDQLPVVAHRPHARLAVRVGALLLEQRGPVPIAAPAQRSRLRGSKLEATISWTELSR